MKLFDLVDGALDLTIAPGFSRAGILARRATWEPLARLDGQTVAISGATSGIGRAAAAELARLGANVILLVRSVPRGERVAEEIGGARVVECDLADLDSVRAAAAQIDELNVLINNAGVLPKERSLSPQGYELTFATNVLGTFALTEGLLPALRAGAPARIITVSSGGMYGQRLDLDALQATTGDFSGVKTYAITKRAQVVLTDEWARRLAADGITAHAMHPGWANTDGVQSSLPGFAKIVGPALRTPGEGADTILWLAGAPAATIGTGQFWHDRRARTKHRLPSTHEQPGDAERLYERCAELTAVP